MRCQSSAADVRWRDDEETDEPLDRNQFRASFHSRSGTAAQVQLRPIGGRCPATVTSSASSSYPNLGLCRVRESQTPVPTALNFHVEYGMSDCEHVPGHDRL